MKEIPLTRGQVPIVDDEDYEWISLWRWYARRATRQRGFYACRAGSKKAGEAKFIYMHRVIMGVSEGFEVDHKERSLTLDNRKSNLRIATRGQNARNSSKRRNNTSGYIGVTYQDQINKWVARITVDGNRRSLGCFTSPEEAAKARDSAAIAYHGDFAALNFPITSTFRQLRNSDVGVKVWKKTNE